MGGEIRPFLYNSPNSNFQKYTIKYLNKIFKNMEISLILCYNKSDSMFFKRKNT